ncbi:MAG: 6-phosphofructokinase [Thermodesulfobacteriota bacterium]|nr:6-phosphofructokinase [Thermodesulfobacteriota bacterium]
MDIETLLNHSKTERVTADINKETIERRAFFPKKCQVFSEEFTLLEDQDQYAFTADLEAVKVLPDIVGNNVCKIVPGHENAKDQKELFFVKKTIGIVFSGGPAPGGHNVIAGIFDAAKKANPESKILGFILGPDGILENRYVEITESLVDAHRNMGGFNMIKTGRAKIDSDKKMKLSKETCRELNLDAIVIVGGDDSNTNAAFLAQELKQEGVMVIGIPKTIDGDIQVKTENGDVLCAISFGFHTAARSFAQNISNLCTDASSDVKYWHICKVMGRVASHLALEVALQTHVNLTLIGEDLAEYVDEERLENAAKKGKVDYTAYGMTLRHLSRLICETIMKRAAHGKNYGVMIIPEGVLEFINEIQIFIIKLNTIIGDYNYTHDLDFHASFPGLESKIDYLRRYSRGISDKEASPIWNARDDELFNDLPSFFQEGLLLERDTHGNFQFSLVKTEKIVLDMVSEYLDILKEKGEYKIGIERDYYKNTMKRAGLDPDLFGEVLFKNYKDPYLLVKKSIISKKTLKQIFVNSTLISDKEDVPEAIMNIFKKSVPKFKTQAHFYGYDGRGNDPTQFDCNYTYNLGWTAFSLIANGVTGQMAVIKNLEYDFSKWEPMGIPIAKLMHLEERKGKLALVIEKSIVDIESNAFRVVKAFREKWMAAEPGEDRYRRPGPVRFTGKSEEDRPITLMLNSIDN